MNRLDKRLIFSVFSAFIFVQAVSQSSVFQDQFSKLFDYSIIPKTTANFKEYYEITIQQVANHTNPNKIFNQRIYLGFQDFNAPTVIVTDGYAIDYAAKPGYSNEVAKELKANLIVVEHRFFGKSIPDSIDWNLLTVKQAADDYHFIKSILDKLLTGKWLSTGISKGGQAALAYKLFYPNDITATLVYGTAIKTKQAVYTDNVLSTISQTNCGKKINELQRYLFEHKSVLLPYFNNFVSEKKFDFKPLDNETVLDYMLLELPFSFWQNGHECEYLVDTAFAPSDLMNYLTKVVPPRFFSSTNKIQLEPAFYMFYHELGYYEYNTKPFIKYLKHKDYSNKYFAPQNVAIQFDNTFQKLVNAFMKSKDSKNVFFIYGENDPWALQTSSNKNTFIIPGGSHKSRIADFTLEEQADIYNKIKACIN